MGERRVGFGSGSGDGGEKKRGELGLVLTEQVRSRQDANAKQHSPAPAANKASFLVSFPKLHIRSQACFYLPDNLGLLSNSNSDNTSVYAIYDGS